MKTVGLIAEYNPFHKGHKYHIEQAKKTAKADTAVVIMSGDFVQRGEPAIADKYTRAEMALLCGADIVIELPMLYAVSSAERFAFGAVGILHFLGVDSICFGSECNDIKMLERIAAVLENEPEEFKISLKKYLAEGDSFPKARQKAFEEYAGLDGAVAGEIMSKPNNLLGIEYIKAAKKYSSDMELFTIKRIGQAYNDCGGEGPCSEENPRGRKDSCSNGFASAAAIRRMILDGNIKPALCQIPEEAGCVFADAIERHKAVTADDFSGMLNYKIYCLMREDSTQLLNFSDVSESIANKITGIYAKEHFSGEWSELVMKLKSRELTYSRISRALLHILLDIKLDTWSTAPMYARILGTTSKGREFISSIRKICPIPIITKAADDSELLRNDIFAADIYNQAVYRKSGAVIKDDYRHSPVLIRIKEHSKG